jgi:tripartite-type tricarboxylate transporter receptor subunit TctC
VASAEPDGSTFLISSIGTHVTSPATSPNPAYDPLRLFTHIAYLGGPPNVIVVHPSLGVKTFEELLAAAKTGHGRELHLARTGNDRASGAGASGAQGKPQIRPRRL